MIQKYKTSTVLCFAALLVLAFSASGQMSGSYTVDPGGSGPRNYTTIGAVLGALNAGVTGPVNVDVKPGTYTEGILVLMPVSGVSSINTVSFVTTGTTPAVIDANGNSVGIFMFDGTAWMNFTNFKVQNFTTIGIYLYGFSSPGVNHCTFNQVECIAPTTTSSTVNSIRMDYSGHNTFLNCQFSGGGRTLNGQQASDNTFLNCKFTGSREVVYSQGMYRSVFDGCEIDGMGAATSLIGPWNANDSDCLFQNCFIHDCSASGRGLYLNVSGYGIMFWHNTIIVNTSSWAVDFGGCCAWSRANSFRNNIVINMGTGVAIRYGASSAGVLDYNDADYNCYYAPNGNACELENGTAFTKGTLAQWQTYFNANRATMVPQTGSAPIPTPAQARWDDNSIESDPGLISMASPYDIHLNSVSPLVDAGTTQYVAGPWISYNPSATVSTDFEGDPRGTLVDIGADELAVRIIATGSPTPGGTVNLNLNSVSDGGLPYGVGSSLGTGPIPIGNRSIGLSPDALLFMSVSGLVPAVFQDYTGVLDASGQAVAKLNIPNIPQVKGLRIYSAFVTIKATAPLGIQSISNTVLISIL